MACNSIYFLRILQRSRIACNAERYISHGNSVCLSVRPSARLSVTRWYPIQKNENRIMRSSLWGSKNILVFWHQQWLGRRPLSLKLCAQNDSPELCIHPIPYSDPPTWGIPSNCIEKLPTQSHKILAIFQWKTSRSLLQLICCMDALIMAKVRRKKSVCKKVCASLVGDGDRP